MFILIYALQNASCFFFFNDTATTEIYTLSYTTLFRSLARPAPRGGCGLVQTWRSKRGLGLDRKSTRLNSSHSQISYAVFCLKKKKKKTYKLSMCAERWLHTI